MDKLINLNIIEAKNVICVWRDDCDEDKDYSCGIALDTAAISYIIPQYIAIGTFDNGKAMAGGLLDLNEINQSDNYGKEHGLIRQRGLQDGRLPAP